MTDTPQNPNVLLRLAAEGVVPVIGGCAGALAGGPEGGLAGVAVGKAVEKAVNLFGRGIVEQWAAWFRARPPADAAAAVSDLVTLTPAAVREQARSVLLELCPDADAADVELAVEYLSALPRSMDRALIPDPAGDGRSIPPTVSLADPRALLQLLPEDVPPYPTGSDLPGTPYRLIELVGSGGFGAVYRAFSPTLQHLPLAIKFCLDRSLLPALNQERSNLERLMRAGGAGADHVVRLYGYDLDHRTPFLVYEFVPGGDLTRHLAARRAALGGPPPPAEVLGWIVQIAEGLGFAHRAKVVHRDLKPANVLVDGGDMRLADFGIGGVVAIRSVAKSRIGASTLEYLSLADQASLFRGAGTPLYMSPEQRRGADPDPRHDLYALGVMWFQLLVGDVTRELPHGWAKELKSRFGVPDGHVALIDRCVGWYDDRPADANELLPFLREAMGGAGGFTSGRRQEMTAVETADHGLTLSARQETITNASAVTPAGPALSPGTVGLRRTLLEETVRKLHAVYAELDRMKRWSPLASAAWGSLVAFPAGLVTAVFMIALVAGRRDSSLIIVPLLFGMLAGLIVLGLYIFVVRAGMRLKSDELRRRAGDLVAELAAEFPAEVERWGGRSVLKVPSAVRQILDELSPPAPPPATPTSGFATEDVLADPTRRSVMIARLREIDSAHDGLDNGVVLYWVGQVLVSALVTPGAFAGVISIGAEQRDRDVMVIIIPLAIVVGLGVLSGIHYGMSLGREALRRAYRESVDRFTRDYPKLVETWGGRDVLEGKETMTALLKQYDPDAYRPGLIGRLFGG